MPYARISLPAGKPASYVAALSDGLHRALVDAFNVPPDDRFQLFEPRQPHERVFDHQYLAGPAGTRSDDWLLVSITAGRPRSAEVKAAFYRALADNWAASPGVAPADVMVVIQTTEPEDWSFGQGIAWTADGARAAAASAAST